MQNFYVVVGHLFALLLFLYGFIPMKPPVSPDNTINRYPKNFEKNALKKSISRTVIVVIDALRADFIYNSNNMPKLTSLLRDHVGCNLTVRAHTPTVTLPRIKALTSGNLPGFADVVLNFASHAFDEENIITLAKESGAKIVFYGDETWTKLFPKHFLRSDGTTSFFVTDYKEVDENVTRHLDSELAANDWDIMILHYLGLDHIGHLIGPQSELVQPKLQEMDEIVYKIYEQFITKVNNSLLIVTGDHGMSDAGSHGGASDAETLVPLIYMSSVYRNQCSLSTKNMDFHQIDFAPTFAALFGLSIPVNNIGSIILPMLDHLPIKEQFHLVLYNAWQVAQVLQKYSVKAEIYLQELFEANNRSVITIEWEKYISKYLSELEDMKSTLIKSVVNYDLSFIFMGIILIWELLLVLFCRFEIHPSDVPYVIMSVVMFICSHSFLSKYRLIGSNLPGIVVCLFAVMNAFNLQMIFTNFNSRIVFKEFTEKSAVLVCGVLLHCVSLLSSSFIEEEHQTWYFLWTTFIMCLLIYELQCDGIRRTKNMLSLCLILFLHRLLRHWNQTGDKWLFLPDIGDWLNRAENSYAKGACLIMGVVIVAVLCSQGHFFDKALLYTGLFFVYLHHEAAYSYFVAQGFLSNRGQAEAVMVYTICAVFVVRGLFSQRATIMRVWIILVLLIFRSHNILLLALSVLEALSYLSYLQSKADFDMMFQAISLLWMGKVFYFYQGNSNSLSTVDVAAGYVGLSTYNPVLTGMLMFCNTFAGPVFCLLLLTRQFRSRRQFKAGLRIILICDILPSAVYVVLVTIQRYHLFVWTVFAPKLLYMLAFTFVYSIWALFAGIIKHLT